MASRLGSSWACGSCGFASAKWLGRCPDCGAWGALEHRAGDSALRPGAVDDGPAAAVLAANEITLAPRERRTTGLGELDRVLGGGLVPGAVVLLAGEPGIGKSTLLLQAAASLATGGDPVLYASGEESATQVALRAERLGARIPALRVAADTDVDRLLRAADSLVPAAVVVDSVQAIRSERLDALPGSVTQVREAAARFADFAKRSGVPVVLVGHVTKDGTIAGPKTLEHLVDVLLFFEGDRHHAQRLLRAIKNRFGPADELAVFDMTERGLREVANPSERLLAERPGETAGSVVHAAIVGTRAIAVEIQALVGSPIQGSPRRAAVGVDPARLAMLLAVLERRAGVPLGDREVYVNVAGGLDLDEPAADLAIALAVASAARERPFPPRWTCFGEIGLGGEIRGVGRVEARLRESARLGFPRAIVPASVVAGPPGDLKIIPATRLVDALRAGALST